MNQPNLLFVFPDEFRQRSLGFRNEDPVITPNLDAFSKDSLELTETISNFPLCSPYRGMLFTGKYPYSNGVVTNCHSSSAQFGNYLKEDEVCISDVLSNCGYDTGYIGKWHLDPGLEEQNPYTEGYRKDGQIWDSYTLPERRHNFNYWYSYGCCDNHFKPHYWYNDAPINKRIDVDEWSPKHEADKAIEYILNKNDNIRQESKPFCLFVSMNPPHMPFDEMPEKYKQYYEQFTDDELLTNPNVEKTADACKGVRGYFAGVTGVDEQFGRILEALDQKGIKENTIVVFTSDHGELMGSHGLMYKSHWYREAVNVPFLIRYPKKNLKGKCDEIINVPDIFPTLLALMGLSDHIPQGVEGENCLPAFEGGKTEPYAYYGIHKSSRGVISKEYTYAVCKSGDGQKKEYLFDNQKDFYQQQKMTINY